MKAFITLALVSLFSTAVLADEYNVNFVHSSALFKVKNAGTINQYGRFNKLEGTINFGADVSKNAVMIKVDAKSVDTAFVKRDEHLKGPDFFDAKKYPEITFKSTSWESKGNDLFHVTGEFTLHGVTKTVTIPVSKTGAGKNQQGQDIIGFEGTFAIKRSEFNMTYAVGPISDEVTLILSVEGVKK